MSSVCCFTGQDDLELILSLGDQPLSNAYLTEAQLSGPEPKFPLNLYVSRGSMLCQINVAATSEEIFTDYAYFSSFSDTWLDHSSHHVASTSQRFGLDQDSFVIEVASNDGYLLKNFVDRGVRCLGIEPAANVAKVANEAGVPTEVRFWGEQSAGEVVAQHGHADMMYANNVYAHVPTINDFVEGFKVALAPQGVASIEVAHLLKLLENDLFDTIYHEHFFYHSLLVTQKIMAAHGLRVFDVEEIPTHGGSIRFYVCHDDADHAECPNVAALLAKEKAAGLDTLAPYQAFASRVAQIRADLLEFLQQAKADGKTVAAYGAPAKGNTLLNYCGITTDLICATADRSPHKQGLYLPGSHIPILSPEALMERRPDYVVILPWNLKDEIMTQLEALRGWGGQFVVPLPRLAIL